MKRNMPGPWRDAQPMERGVGMGVYLGAPSRGRSMKRYLAIVGFAALALMAGCSSNTGNVAVPSADPVATSLATSTTAATSAAPRANGATTDACRSLATDKDLAAFWKARNAGQTEFPFLLVSGALLAVQGLEAAGEAPGVDHGVAFAMKTAADGAAAMRTDMAKTKQFDPSAFGSIITPVITACQTLGVDMGMPN